MNENNYNVNNYIAACLEIEFRDFMHDSEAIHEAEAEIRRKGLEEDYL